MSKVVEAYDSLFELLGELDYVADAEQPHDVTVAEKRCLVVGIGLSALSLAMADAVAFAVFWTGSLTAFGAIGWLLLVSLLGAFGAVQLVKGIPAVRAATKAQRVFFILLAVLTACVSLGAFVIALQLAYGKGGGGDSGNASMQAPWER